MQKKNIEQIVVFDKPSIYIELLLLITSRW